jgi:hypothetical protein
VKMRELLAFMLVMAAIGSCSTLVNIRGELSKINTNLQLESTTTDKG